jgi:hypothetical protein
VVLAVLLAAMTGVTGCGALEGGGGATGDGATSAGTREPGDDATMPTEVPSWLLECGQDDKERDEELQLADLDLTTATWSTPAGFAETAGYVEDNPVETLHSAWYAEPTDPPMPTLNVIQVVVYTGLDWDGLADGCGRVPLEAIEEQLARYREQIDAQPLSDAEITTLAGRPAIQQDIGLASYQYTGWWLFSQTQLLHLYCQWTPEGDRAVIERGCDDLAASVQVG